MKKKDWVRLVIFILIIEAIVFLSSFLCGDIAASYRTLIKPPFSLPDIIFGIVWPILYAMLGAAASIIYPVNSKQSSRAFTWFIIQLLLNFIWSIIFFCFHTYWAALIIFILIDIIAAYMISLFRKVNKYPALLLIPYMIWVLFVTYLNWGIALLN